MAKSRRIVPNPAVRGLIREHVLRGSSIQETADAVASYFPSQDEHEVELEIRAERRRQSVVRDLATADKRRNVDFGRRIGCRGKDARARWGVTIFWRDEQTGETRQFNWFGETPVRGRLANLINAVLQSAMAQAEGKGYTPARVTSADTSGSAYYRINYVECV